jgi:hypothetical protein
VWHPFSVFATGGGAEGRSGGFSPSSFLCLFFSGENWRSGEEGGRVSVTQAIEEVKLILFDERPLSAVGFGCYVFPLFFSSSVVIVKGVVVVISNCCGPQSFSTILDFSTSLFFFLQQYRANQSGQSLPHLPFPARRD